MPGACCRPSRPLGDYINKEHSILINDGEDLRPARSLMQVLIDSLCHSEMLSFISY